MTQIKKFDQINQEAGFQLSKGWDLSAIQSDECLSYVAWNKETKEAVVVDPKVEDMHAYLEVASGLKDFRFIAVIDTHTHADHISCAADLAQKLHAPLVMHVGAPSKRVDLRVARDTDLSAQAGPVHVCLTPGHTQDSITVLWGPFIFGGDTLLFNDIGRDDLPGGSAQDHYQSVQCLKARAQSQMVILPGHDHKGGRASSWAFQLKNNSSLTQPKKDFIREAEAFNGASPRLLKESLKENFK